MQRQGPLPFCVFSSVCTDDATFTQTLAPPPLPTRNQDPRLATFLSEHKDLPYADFDRSGAAPVSSSSRPARDRAPAPAPARATTSTAPPVATAEAAPVPAKPAAPPTDRPGTERDYSRDDDRYHDEDSYRRGGASGTRQAVGGDEGPAAGDVMRETFRNVSWWIRAVTRGGGRVGFFWYHTHVQLFCPPPLFFSISPLFCLPW